MGMGRSWSRSPFHREEPAKERVTSNSKSPVSFKAPLLMRVVAGLRQWSDRWRTVDDQTMLSHCKAHRAWRLPPHARTLRCRPVAPAAHLKLEPWITLVELYRLQGGAAAISTALLAHRGSAPFQARYPCGSLVSGDASLDVSSAGTVALRRVPPSRLLCLATHLVQIVDTPSWLLRRCVLAVHEADRQEFAVNSEGHDVSQFALAIIIDDEVPARRLRDMPNDSGLNRVGVAFRSLRSFRRLGQSRVTNRSRSKGGISRSGRRSMPGGSTVMSFSNKTVRPLFFRKALSGILVRRFRNSQFRRREAHNSCPWTQTGWHTRPTTSASQS